MTNTQPVTLKRTLSLSLLTLYGLGTMVGVGIYALIGKVAAEALYYTPLAFLVSAAIGLLTAMTYAELSARFPKSAGEAYYVSQAFQRPWLSGLTGWLIVLTGLVSAATLAHGFAGYLTVFVPTISANIALVAVTLLLGLIACAGIQLSAYLAAGITLLEIAGLLWIVWIARDAIADFSYSPATLLPGSAFKDWQLVFSGALIAFYAFIGFEDMVNVAEEVKQPEKTLPRAIFLAFFAATLLYLLVAIALLAALPMQQLADSKAPFASFMAHYGYAPYWVSLIGLIAIVNGMLVQIIMASRVMYGLANQGQAPTVLGRVNQKTQTPIIATLLTLLCLLILALGLPIATLAKLTSLIILWVFLLLHIGLMVIKIKSPAPGTLVFPKWIPPLGALSILFFLGVQWI